MLCCLITRVNEGFKIDYQSLGYGNMTVREMFAAEGINIEKEINDMQIGESKVWNIGWFPNDIVHRRYLPEKVIR